FGRFRAYYPVTSGGSKIIVHSKTSVFDDRLARIGSANLNNRSFGFDTEIEVALEAEDEDARRVVAAFRDRLVAHFLGYTGDAVAKARAQLGGLIPAIDALNRDGRLRPIEPSPQTTPGRMIAAYHLGDPASPEDAWRPWRRRECLYRDHRTHLDQARSKSITSGR
ncbi:MAG: phospholipase D-like domain-containing protein, partial [Phenylobacterium sp.]|nr:phospholipase D-like domain-containing protein [Phenylobacterium sp.]